MLSERDIAELQAIALEESGVVLTREQAIDEGERWLAAMRAIYRPIPYDSKVWLEEE